MNLLREKARALGHHCPRCADAPDMSGANAAAVAQAELSREQLEWVKGVYAAEAPNRQAAADRANTVADTAVESMRKADARSDEAADYHRTTFRPIEETIAREAMEYDTPERRAQVAGQAMADVGSQGAIARATNAQEMAARGVDPSSGSAGLALSRIGAAEAAAKAAAGNSAINQVETVGAARRADAANLGRGIASGQATQASLALNAGQGATAAGAAGQQVAQGAAGMVGGAYGTAIQGLGSSANAQLGIANAQANAAGQGMAGLGSLAGAGMMAFAV